MDELIEFGAKVKEFRLRKGLSQERLAEDCNLDRTYVSGVERGKRNISLKNIYKISRALQISPADFFEV
jgi:transcriptional regulator with XRE-family HTH domain